MGEVALPFALLSPPAVSSCHEVNVAPFAISVPSTVSPESILTIAPGWIVSVGPWGQCH